MIVVAAEKEKERALVRPFIKWVGGKRQLLPSLLRYAPGQFATYHEPFIGGGALYFSIKPAKAVLSDINERLIRTYIGVRDNVEEVIERLRSFPHEKAFYLKTRGRDIDACKSDAEVAAWFIYLNKTGFNGLYRVNSRNGFNVPFGSYVNPKICDDGLLRACSVALKTASIFKEDFSAVLGRAKAGDFVYFDPPYVPLTATSSFTSYTADGFGPVEQRKLRDVAMELKLGGVNVLLSNSSAGLVKELYRRDFELIEVHASRMINCDATGRGRIVELLIR